MFAVILAATDLPGIVTHGVTAAAASIRPQRLKADAAVIHCVDRIALLWLSRLEGGLDGLRRGAP